MCSNGLVTLLLVLSVRCSVTKKVERLLFNGNMNVNFNDEQCCCYFHNFHIFFFKKKSSWKVKVKTVLKFHYKCYFECNYTIPWISEVLCVIFVARQSTTDKYQFERDGFSHSISSLILVRTHTLAMLGTLWVKRTQTPSTLTHLSIQWNMSCMTLNDKIYYLIETCEMFASTNLKYAEYQNALWTPELEFNIPKQIHITHRSSHMWSWTWWRSS